MSTGPTRRRFHFIRLIASGGFGAVWLCKVMHADGFSRLAAVKLLHPRWTENEEIARRMRDEARLLGWLRHRNIVDVVDLTSIDGRAAIIMEYLEAVDLKTIIGELSEGTDLVPPRVCLQVMAYVASALDAAYNKAPYQGEKPLHVIHRDIKPSNIMVDEAGVVKVLDFGVARAEFEARESHTRELQFGSVDYMPPERLFFEPETPASDVYSLGACMFEVILLEKLGKAKGRPERHARFLADRMSFMRARLPIPGAVASEIEQLLTSCLSFDHEQRPSAADVSKSARKIARKLAGESLAEWAEETIPELLEEIAAKPVDTNPLTDQILSEDSSVFGVSVTEEGGSPPPPPADEPRLSAPPVSAPAPAAPTPAQPSAPEDEDGDIRPTVVSRPTIVPEMWEDPPADGGSPFGGAVDPDLEATRVTPFVQAAEVAEEDDEFDPDLQATRIQQTPEEPVQAAPPPAPPPLPEPDSEEEELPTVMEPPLGGYASPPPPAPGQLPGLEPSMDDWDDVPTRIEQMAAVNEEKKRSGQAYFPGEQPVDHGAATQVLAQPAGNDDATAVFTAQPTPPPPSYDPNEAATAVLPDQDRPPPPAPVHGQPPPPPPVHVHQQPPPPPPGDGPVPRPSTVEEAPKKSSKLPLILGGVFGFVVVCTGLCGFGGFLAKDQIAAQLASQGGFEVPEIEVPEGEPEAGGEPEVEVAPEPEPEPEPEPVAEGGIRFHTDLDVKKLKASCTDGKGEGVAVAVVDLEADAKCSVTAYMKDRTRRTATVTDVTEGDYHCFQGDADDCVR